MIPLLRRHQKRRALFVAEIVLLAIGFLCLGWVGYMTARREIASSWDAYRFEQALQRQPATVAGYLKFLWTGDRYPQARRKQPAPPAPRPTRKIAPDELIGRIEIPRVKVSTVVKEGVGKKTLSLAAGHVPYTALPGEKGNVGVAAHRDTFFRGLRDIRQGDLVRMTTLNGVYIYQVDGMRIVWPSNIEVLDPTPDARLTMVTCYPFNYIGSAPKRFIVQAKQVGFEKQTADAATSRPAPVEDP